MGNLFEGWPRERLADIYSQWWIPENPGICAHYYRLCRRISARPREWPARAWDYALGHAESLDGIASFRMTPRLRQWIARFAPQVVYSHLGPLWLTRLTNQVVSWLGVPLVVHINDDYIVDWPVNGHERRRVFPFAQALHALNNRQFRSSLSTARVRIVVSELMRQEYQRRYGWDFEVVTNGVDPAAWPCVDLPERRPDANHPFVVLYTGSVAANTNLASLHDASTAVAGLAAQGVPIRLLITRQSDPAVARALEKPPYVTFIDTVPHSRMPGRLADSDLLLLPFNFDDGSVRFIRYSWPTKMPEFMISGRPILLYGPADTAFGEYARRESWACVVDRRDPRLLSDALVGLMADYGRRRDLTVRARQLVLKEQDLHQTRRRFQNLIRQAV